MQSLHSSPALDAPVLVLGPRLALTVARTAGVPLFTRCPPVHSIILGRCRLRVAGSVQTLACAALPANTPHSLLALEGPHAGVAYLDPRRYRFEDVQRLADSWSGFVPGRDDLREAFGDALKLPAQRVPSRLLRALDALDQEQLSVADAARRVQLSDSHLTHLITAALGAPPRVWRTWFRLRRAIGESVFAGANLTQAAHRAGFADSAHLTRTCKQLMGVRPALLLPKIAHVSTDE
jgi:AraC-like DNA-binding protein